MDFIISLFSGVSNPPESDPASTTIDADDADDAEGADASQLQPPASSSRELREMLPQTLTPLLWRLVSIALAADFYDGEFLF